MSSAVMVREFVMFMACAPSSRALARHRAFRSSSGSAASRPHCLQRAGVRRWQRSPPPVGVVRFPAAEVFEEACGQRRYVRSDRRTACGHRCEQQGLLRLRATATAFPACQPTPSSSPAVSSSTQASNSRSASVARSRSSPAASSSSGSCCASALVAVAATCTGAPVSDGTFEQQRRGQHAGSKCTDGSPDRPSPSAAVASRGHGDCLLPRLAQTRERGRIEFVDAGLERIPCMPLQLGIVTVVGLLSHVRTSASSARSACNARK